MAAAGLLAIPAVKLVLMLCGFGTTATRLASCLMAIYAGHVPNASITALMIKLGKGTTLGENICIIFWGMLTYVVSMELIWLHPTGTSGALLILGGCLGKFYWRTKTSRTMKAASWPMLMLGALLLLAEIYFQMPPIYVEKAEGYVVSQFVSNFQFTFYYDI